MLRNRYFLSKPILTTLLLVSGGIILTACESPNPVKANILPDGYVWHDSTPLESPPDTQPWLVEKNIDPVAHDLSKEQWLHAADDLVTNLRKQQGRFPSKVVLQQASNEDNAIERSFDNYLRELLITRDIEITTNPAEARKSLVYNAVAPDEHTRLNKANINNARTKTMDKFLQELEGKPVLKLTLSLKSKGRTEAIAQGLYHVHGQDRKPYEWALIPAPRYEKKYAPENFNE